MHRYIALFVMVFAMVLQGKIVDSKKALKPISKTYFKTAESSQNSMRNLDLSTSTPIRYPNNSRVEAVLVDSSVNGYGMYVSATKPLSYHPDKGYFMCYRQWMPNDPPVPGGDPHSGYIGGAWSPDGLEWETYQNFNVTAPGEEVGRYPSSVAGPEYPYAIWNEYTSGSGGGDYGGRPLYSWDQFYYGGGSFFSPAVDLNNGCNPEPCDPPDNWVSSPSLNEDASGNLILNVAFDQWSGNPIGENRWLYHSSFHASGYFIFNDAYLLFDGADFPTDARYTSDVIVDINDDGVGYGSVVTYFGDAFEETAHTLALRKTTDYGATWSTDGMGGTDYYFIPDSTLKHLFWDPNGQYDPGEEFEDTNGNGEWDEGENWTDEGYLSDYYVFVDEYGDSTEYIMEDVFLGYETYMKVDGQGGVHFMAAAVLGTADGIYTSLDDNCGFYHFYSSDPSDPSTWEISFVASMAESFLDYYHADTWFLLFPHMAVSSENSNIMYASYWALADTNASNWNYDIYVRRSQDGGRTWEESMNITQTNDYQADETFPHLCPTATNTTCTIMYAVPDYTTETVVPAVNPADYKNRIMFATVDFSEAGITENGSSFFPDKFSLAQNYPNPFNPETSIQFDLNSSSKVELVVFDLLGQKVETLMNEKVDAGSHDVIWDASNYSAGVYFYRLTAAGISDTKKMILLK